MKCLRLLFALLLFSSLSVRFAFTQCSDNTPDPYDPVPACNQVLLNGLGSGQFHATPLIDSVQTNGMWPDYGDPDHNIVSLYGTYGNNEKTSSSPAQAHYTQGKTLASQIQPLCSDGTTSTPCSDGKPKWIVFLFIGFSNTDIEIGGGNSDVWDGSGDSLNPDPANHFNGHLFGQPCSTLCENLFNPDGVPAWNQVIVPPGGDGYTQDSLLHKVYPDSDPQHWLVGPDVVLFNGALGQQTLAKWDPTPSGYYAIHQNCSFDHQAQASPECNYVRVKDDLARNGFSEAQVQAVFIKSADNFPHCDLKKAYWDVTCVPSAPLMVVQDTYQAETYLGDILRYLKCCKGGPGQAGGPRYPNLKQVFVTSRIYGGWANGNPNGCLNPEPFGYEEGFAVQRAIVAQINQTNGITPPTPDSYSGQLDYTVAPWFDWAPYLWADGVNLSPGSGLNWCDYTTRTDRNCLNTSDQGDVRFGDIDQGWTQYYGDQIHPTGWGTKKVAQQLLNWIQDTPPAGQPYISDWFGYGGSGTPWIKQ